MIQGHPQRMSWSRRNSELGSVIPTSAHRGARPQWRTRLVPNAAGPDRSSATHQPSASKEQNVSCMPSAQIDLSSEAQLLLLPNRCFESCVALGTRRSPSKSATASRPHREPQIYSLTPPDATLYLRRARIDQSGPSSARRLVPCVLKPRLQFQIPSWGCAFRR